MHLIGRALSPNETRTFTIEYVNPASKLFEKYQEEAHSGWITDGGALVFKDQHDGVISVVSPACYTQAAMLR